ncbi:MAG: hypothetical protein RI947_1238 [Candidatus Parcubacteria bacterium]|jgi:oligoendopeptidase F
MTNTDKNLEKLPTTWDLTPLLDGDDDPSIETIKQKITSATNTFISTWKNRTDYLENPTVLREALDQYEELQQFYGLSGNIGYYFSLRNAQDSESPAIKAKLNMTEQFALEIQNNMQFFYLNISRIQPTKQTELLSHESLRKYKHFLERIFAESKYILSDAEEKILNLKSLPAYENWVRMTASFLAKEERTVLTDKGKKSKLPFNGLISLMNHQHKEVRDSAAKAFNEVVEKYVEVGEAEMNAILADKKINDQLRGIARPDLMRHISDDIETTVVDTLVSSVSKRFDIPSRYYALKAKLMGVDKLQYHERNVEYGSIDKKYDYEDAVELVYAVFYHLDPSFADILKSFTEKGQLDVYPGKGKRGGAFCAHELLSQPTYVLLNHTGQLNDVLTLAHEMGHAINNELMRKQQHALYFGSPLSTAEVASTFMEDFVLEHILKDAAEELRLSIMMKKLNDDVSTIFRQISLYQFEQEMHASHRAEGYLSKEQIGELFSKHMAAYMGDAVDKSPGSQNWWLYWSHIRSYFYVYSYASGLLISKSLQSSVKQDPTFIEKVKDFLSSGLSDSPVNIFNKMSINIADPDFWQKGIGETEELLNQTEALAKKMGKI